MVKKAETVREKTEKANSVKAPKKKGILSLSLRYIGAPFRLIGRLIVGLGRFLGKFRIFRFIGKILWPVYFRNSWKELRQVTWPTRRETWQLTLAVIIFSIVFGVLVAVTDYGLNNLFREVLLK